MSDIVALPVRGEVFLDARDHGRAMRMSWHHDDGIVVFSLWRDQTCVATFQLAKDDVPTLVTALAEGLAQGYCSSESAGTEAG